jgi:hypothetical protein
LAPSLAGIVPVSDTAGDDLAKAAYVRWGWSPPERAEDVVNEYWRWHFHLKTDAGLELVRRLDLNPTHQNTDGVAKEENALEVAAGQIPPELRENWRWKVFEARVAMDRLLCRIELTDEVLSQIASEMKRAAKGRTTKAGLLKAVTEALDRLREREKLVEKLAQVADELQHRVYRVGPERDLVTNGYRLAEDCGRGSLKGWVSRLQAAAGKRGFADLRTAVKDLVDRLDGQS